MEYYHDIASKAEYIADIARSIDLDAPELSITEQARVAYIYRQLCNIADCLDEIAPIYSNID